MYLLLKAKGYRLQAELTKDQPAPSPSKADTPSPARRRLPVGFTRNPAPASTGPEHTTDEGKS